MRGAVHHRKIRIDVSDYVCVYSARTFIIIHSRNSPLWTHSQVTICKHLILLISLFLHWDKIFHLAIFFFLFSLFYAKRRRVRRFCMCCCEQLNESSENWVTQKAKRGVSETTVCNVWNGYTKTLETFSMCAHAWTCERMSTNLLCGEMCRNVYYVWNVMWQT